jgi:hypothetical protein
MKVENVLSYFYQNLNFEILYFMLAILYFKVDGKFWFTNLLHSPPYIVWIDY